MSTTILWQIILQFFLIFLNAIFACAEIAVLSVNGSRLAQLAESGNRNAVRLLRLTEQPARFLATIQVAITLSGFLGSAFAADNFSEILVVSLQRFDLPVSYAVLDTISVILITLILSYFTLVLGELVPKRLAMKKAEQIALALSGLICLIAKLFAPLVWVLTLSTNALLRLCGVAPDGEEETVSEEEIRRMVDFGAKKGVIDSEESELIRNVFEFDDISVSEFLTHRTELSLLWLDDSTEEWDRVIREQGHALYPVCGESADQIIGVLSVRDYLRLTDLSRETILKQAVKQAYFVPETVCADVLFRRMKLSRNHMAVVLDEYGGTAGIVTMSDLLEQLVGDLDDWEESEEVTPDLQKIDEFTYQIRGSVPLDEVAEALDMQLPVEDYDTFGGFVFGSYGMVPEDGSCFELETCSLQIKVREIREHRLESALVCRMSCG